MRDEATEALEALLLRPKKREEAHDGESEPIGTTTTCTVA